LPSLQVETELRGVQNGTRGSAEVEAGQARAGEFTEIKQEPEIKQEHEIEQEPQVKHEPFTIRGYCGIRERITIDCTE